MIEHLQNELYQLENKRAKGPKLCANIRSCWEKYVPKLSSKNLKDRIWKIKQYLNYIMMIINQNILAILRTFFKSVKKLWNSTPSELSKPLLLNLFAKFLTERKSLMTTLIFVRLTQQCFIGAIPNIRKFGLYIWFYFVSMSSFNKFSLRISSKISVITFCTIWPHF